MSDSFSGSIHDYLELGSDVDIMTLIANIDFPMLINAIENGLNGAVFLIIALGIITSAFHFFIKIYFMAKLIKHLWSSYSQ